jgi:PTS system nitrogen regulatory IIA component
MGTATKQAAPMPAIPMDIDLSSVISAERIAVNQSTSSKKRLLEQMTDLLLATDATLDRNAVAQTLIERERLGSTGIGHGVALPHGRVKDLDAPSGAFAVLEAPVDFDALDGQPVDLVFALLVPSEATDEHLRILARLAAMFNDGSLRDALRRTRSSADAYDLLIGWKGSSAGGP